MIRLNKMKHSKMIIKNLEIKVHLGVTPKEQSSLQKINWTAEYTLKKSSKKFLCYQSFCQKLTDHSKSQKFSLMEEMTSFCFKKMKKDFPQIQFLRLQLHKISPPVKNLKGGVVYQFGDF